MIIAAYPVCLQVEDLRPKVVRYIITYRHWFLDIRSIRDGVYIREVKIRFYSENVFGDNGWVVKKN